MSAGASSLIAACKGAGWPWRNLYNMATAEPPRGAARPDVRGSFSGQPLRPFHDKLSDYVAVQAGQLPKILLAVVVWCYTVDMRAAAGGWDFGPTGWVAKVVLRDLFLMVLVAGGWDFLLYSPRSPVAARLAPYKFHSAYPPAEQYLRDIFWTTSATLLASAQEVLLMRWWASGSFTSAPFGRAPANESAVPYDAPFFGTEETAVFSTPALPLLGAVHFHDYTACFILWTASMLYWRILHFYCIHRGMHPWWDRRYGLLDGDVGAFLYRHVHSHHHKSYNPTAFSGISMTPVESTAYLSAALIPLLFRHGCHPWIHLYTKIDLIVGAQIGHDGFDAPGGGSYYHQLHHAHFECNYGDAAFPLDWLFGTFEDGTRWQTPAKSDAKSK